MMASFHWSARYDAIPSVRWRQPLPLLFQHQLLSLRSLWVDRRGHQAAVGSRFCDLHLCAIIFFPSVGGVMELGVCRAACGADAAVRQAPAIATQRCTRVSKHSQKARVPFGVLS